MAKREIFILLVILACAFSNELEDIEQKKRGAGKANPLNSIPTGAQKPDYSYNLYSQSQSAQSPSQSYQAPAQNSFYPSQDNSYYNSNSGETSNPTQSQISTQSTHSQFVPINFVPNPGYQTKYQLVPAKPGGNIQLAIVPSPYQTPPIVQYPQGLFANPGHGQSPPILPIGTPGHYAFNPNIPGLSLGGPFSQPSMILLPQSNPSLYNNLLYPNPSQSFYNYYPSNSQAKYSYTSGVSPSEYDKGSVQNVQKDESDVNAQNSEYISPSDASSAYKSNYSRRSAFTKYK
ncbi:uncharacterized protein LOC121735010 [Aricia agestis]|uniref:uncharacterized protein LOC121735010 n=1 Tax=Aricia agestis TaxID=91739 RepID=UPI001C206E23|nr:uncharacterized protein LOC121735010 [Aricia agestis]